MMKNQCLRNCLYSRWNCHIPFGFSIYYGLLQVHRYSLTWRIACSQNRSTMKLYKGINFSAPGSSGFHLGRHTVHLLVLSVGRGLVRPCGWWPLNWGQWCHRFPLAHQDLLLQSGRFSHRHSYFSISPLTSSKLWSLVIFGWMLLKYVRDIADSVQTEYCSTFHYPSVCLSQAWHLTFLTYIKA